MDKSAQSRPQHYRRLVALLVFLVGCLTLTLTLVLMHYMGGCCA